jgi:hypothetical protein
VNYRDFPDLTPEQWQADYDARFNRLIEQNVGQPFHTLTREPASEHLKRRVVCEDDGTVYESATAASVAIGAKSKVAVASSIHKGIRCFGKQFRYIDPPSSERGEGK